MFNNIHIMNKILCVVRKRNTFQLQFLFLYQDLLCALQYYKQATTLE